MQPQGSIDALIATFEHALEGRPGYAVGLIGLAELVAGKHEPVKAYQLARKALEAAPDDAELVVRARQLLHGLAPGYHVPLMNNAARNAAWDAALRRAIGPQTRALEIGTGAGMLALMAARAGARKVTTCERSPLLALLAAEIAERNGYADRIEVIAKPSDRLEMGVDLDAPADLLFCDIFGDNLFDFGPLAAVADARRRLCRPDARVVPAACSVRVALADFERYGVVGRIETAAGFDLTPFANFAPARLPTAVGEPGLTLLSAPEDLFGFDLAAPDLPQSGRREVTLVASADAVATGVVHWLRLQLDEETVLEARPAPGAASYARPRFWPFASPKAVRRGEPFRVAAAHTATSLSIWPAGADRN
jgi:type II protein arginine methyltransferase